MTPGQRRRLIKRLHEERIRLGDWLAQHEHDGLTDPWRVASERERYRELVDRCIGLIDPDLPPEGRRFGVDDYFDRTGRP